jgi:hypothetical protein
MRPAAACLSTPAPAHPPPRLLSKSLPAAPATLSVRPPPLTPRLLHMPPPAHLCACRQQRGGATPPQAPRRRAPGAPFLSPALPSLDREVDPLLPTGAPRRRLPLKRPAYSGRRPAVTRPLRTAVPCACPPLPRHWLPPQPLSSRHLAARLGPLAAAGRAPGGAKCGRTPAPCRQLCKHCRPMRHRWDGGPCTAGLHVSEWVCGGCRCHSMRAVRSAAMQAQQRCATMAPPGGARPVQRGTGVDSHTARSKATPIPAVAASAH